MRSAIEGQTVEHGADRAMGLELMAIDVEERLEWAEAQGRADDVRALTLELAAVLGQLADVAETIPALARAAA